MAKELKNIRTACIIWKGPDVSPVKQYDTGDIAIYKIVDLLKKLEKKVEIIQQRQ